MQLSLERERERDGHTPDGAAAFSMFGMIRNWLFGATEESEYKLLSTESKVTHTHTHTIITAQTV